MSDPNLYLDDHLKFIHHLSPNRTVTDDDDSNNSAELNALLESFPTMTGPSKPGQSEPQLPTNGQQPTSSSGSSINEFEYTNKIALDYIWPTFPIGFLVLGTVANLLSIIVFRRREMKKFSSFCYFFYLNCVNLAVLYVTMVRVIGEFNFQVDIRRLSLVSLYPYFVLFNHVFI